MQHPSSSAAMPKPPPAKRGRPTTRARTAVSSSVQQTTTSQETSTRPRSPRATPARELSTRARRRPRRLEPTTDTPVASTAAASSVSSDNILREQVLSLQQTVEGLAGIVQQLAAQANNRETASNNTTLPESEVTNSQSFFPSRSGPASEAGGEFTTIPAVVTHQAPRPILFAAGLPAGYHLSDHTKTKIWLHKYVDFHEIFNHTPHDSAYTMSLNSSNNTPTLNFVPQKKRPITETEWSTAWDDFLAVYTQKHPNDLSDLITYSRHIKELMRSGANWRYYDHQFRVDREYSLCSWAAVRVDLQLTATLNKPTFTPHNTQPFLPARSFRANTPRQQQNRPPPGYCYNYHSQYVRCTTDNCQYKHACPKCNRSHPMYRSCFTQVTTSTNRGKLPYNKPSNTNQNTRLT